MKFEACLGDLREDRKLYNSQYHQLLVLEKKPNRLNPSEIDIYLVDGGGCRVELYADLLLSDKWSVVE